MTVRLLTTEEVAQRFRTSPSTVRYWRHQGIDPSGIGVGHRVFYDDAECDRWWQSKVDAAPECWFPGSDCVGLRRHVYPVLGDRPLVLVLTSDIQSLVKRLSGVLAPSTVGVVHRILAAVFKAAVRDRRIVASPCEGTRSTRWRPSPTPCPAATGR